MSVQRINFTKRSRLTRKEANVTVHPDGDRRPATFEATLNLAKLRDTAGDARVFVEAYHQTTRMRFPFGTVATPAPPPPGDLKLTEFADWRDVLFRVKVTDVTGTPGRLIAWADRIKPQGPDDQDEKDLLPFRDVPLYGRLWDLDFTDEGPVVLIEKEFGYRTVGFSPAFQAAAYPEIMRRVLEYAFLQQRVPYPSPDHWSTIWVDGLIKAKLRLPSPPDVESDGEDRVRDWITNVVETHALRHDFASIWGEGMKESA